MARRKRTPERAEKPNPYRNYSDRALADEWASMLEAYADRMEYFDALPEWQHAHNMKIIKDDPEAWGLSRGEFHEWCASLIEHFVAGADMREAYLERHRRAYEAERARVAALPDYETARAEADAQKPPRAAEWYYMRPDETIREYITRREKMNDATNLWHAASAGASDVWERWFKEREASW